MNNAKQFNQYLATHTLEETFWEASETYEGCKLLCEYFLEVHQDWECTLGELRTIKTSSNNTQKFIESKSTPF